MRTTIDIPDELFRAAKAKAALEGRPLKSLILEGLERVMQAPAPKKRKLRTTKFPLVKSSGTGQQLTNEMVQKAIDDYYEEEARYYAQFVRH